MRFKKHVAVLLALLITLIPFAPAFAAGVEFASDVVISGGTATVSGTVYGEVYNELIDGLSVTGVVYDVYGDIVDTVTYTVCDSVYSTVYSQDFSWVISDLIPGDYTMKYSVGDSVYYDGPSFEVEPTPTATPTPTPTATPTPTPTVSATSTPAPGGGDIGGGGVTNPTPVTSEVQADGKVLVNAVPTLDATTKTATAAISSADFTAALAKAIAGSDGVKTVVIEVAKVDGAQSYLAKLPEAALAAGNDDTKVVIKTDIATATLASNMFAASTTGAEYGISIGLADTTGLPQSVLTQLGNKPVIELKAYINGSAVNWSNPDAPATIAIPYTPTAEELKDSEHIVIWYIDGSGKVVSVPSGRYDAATGKVTFSTTHFSKFAAAYVTKSFSDITGIAWAKKQIEVLASKGIINGTSATTFTPAANITRADFLTLLVKSLSLSAKTNSNFSDIPAGAYYAEQVAIAKKLGITTGVGDNKFDPKSNISRQDMMVMTYKALKLVNKASSGTSADIASFTDKAGVASYAVESVSSLIKGGLVLGSDNKINPKGLTTRAEAAVMLYRVYNK